MASGKIETYLGFCIRSGKIVFGVDGLEKLKKGIVLLLYGEDLAENSLKKLIGLKERFACPLIQTPNLGELLHRPSVKAAGIQEKNLASAILKAAESEPMYRLYSGGNN